MNTTVECIGGSARKLVDARFLRPLDAGERGRLEGHLSACSFCSERYRRLQLAERVAAVGAERALDEPSSFEIERIARDLDLFGDPGPGLGARLRRRFFSVGLGAIAAAAVAAIALLVVVPRAGLEDRPVERGGTALEPTIAAYVVSKSGDIRVFVGEAGASEFLKLRVEFPTIELAGGTQSIEVVLPGDKKLSLALPDSGSRVRTAEGSIALFGLPKRSRIAFSGKSKNGATTFSAALDLSILEDGAR